MLFYLLTAFLAQAQTPHTTTVGNVTFRYIGAVSYPEPTYCFLEQLVVGKWSLIMNRFKAFDAGTVSIIKDIKSEMENFSKAEIVPLFSDLFWPNWVLKAPEGTFPDGTATFIVADGFILPGTTPGNIYAISVNETLDTVKSYSLTGSKWDIRNYGQLYTLAEFHDFQGKGKYDILATRARDPGGPIFKPYSTHLCLLQQPEDPTQPWTETFLTDDADFSFVTQLFPDGKHMGVFTGSFFYSKVSYYVMDLNNYPPTISSQYIVDITAGHIYSLQLVDLNDDGKLELMVSNHEENNTTLAGVYVYELPDSMYDWIHVEQYKRTQITSGYIPYKPSTGKAAPGFPIPFYPGKKKSGPQHIFLQGDDDGGYYLLSPTDTDFKYTKDLVYQFEGTVGYPAVGDVDDDGYNEFFLPDYEHDLVHLYTNCPKEECSY